MRALRIVGLSVVVIVAAAAWGVLLLVHTEDFGDRPVGAIEIVLAILLLAALVAGLLGGPYHVRAAGAAVVGGLALAAWSLFLLGETRYLEPLPYGAGTLAVCVLLAAALGAGLLGGWRWWTLLAVPATAVGLRHISEGLFDSGVSYDPYHPALIYALLLAPVVIGIGALATRLTGRGRAVGVALLVLPLLVVAWAAFRHARPIDRHPRDVYLIEQPALPAMPSYRSLDIREGDGRERMRAVLGEPDEVDGPRYAETYRYGRDTIFVEDDALTGSTRRDDFISSILIRDPRAETAEGVGIGDNLALVPSRYPGVSCYVPLGDFEPACSLDTTRWVGNDSEIVFVGDPIESIVLSGLPS